MEVTYLFQLMLFFLCKDNRQQTDKIDMVMRILVAWDIIHLASHKCVLILYILIIGPKNTWSKNKRCLDNAAHFILFVALTI